MKLIIRQYLAGLRERNELDAVLPDLLSQMGLTVYSRPGRGTRQDGVDVGAVGTIDGGPEKVYLFSIKSGDLTRKDWDGDTVQSLRPSLNEIIDAYIPNRLPTEHRGKEVVICPTFGGDVQEQVRPQFNGFMAQNTEPGPLTLKAPSIRDLSRDGTELLIASAEWLDKNSIWLQPVAGGSPRRIGAILADDAAFGADGTSILYCQGHDVYAANRDGSLPQKLFTVEYFPAHLRFSPDHKHLRFTQHDQSSGLARAKRTP